MHGFLLSLREAHASLTECSVFRAHYYICTECSAYDIHNSIETPRYCVSTYRTITRSFALRISLTLSLSVLVRTIVSVLVYVLLAITLNTHKCKQNATLQLCVCVWSVRV